MKRLPPRAVDAATAQDAASDALGWPQDSIGEFSLTPFGDPGGAPAASIGEGFVADQSPHTDLDAAAPAVLANLANPAADSFGAFISDASIGSDDARAAFGASGDTPAATAEEGTVDYQTPNTDVDAAAPAGSGGLAATAVSPAPATFVPAPAILARLANPTAASFGASITEASIGSNYAIAAPVQEGIVGYHAPHTGLYAVAPADGGVGAMAASLAPAISAPTDLASLANPAVGSFEVPITDASIGSNGATAAQVQQALDESGLSVNGAGIRVGVLSDSFNDLGGAAADEADGALPPAADIDVIKDLASGGTDEGRAMMQIIHDIAPGASLAFYTAFDSEQDFANGILALAAAGCKVIVDDVSYFDEPFFQNGVVAQAIQTVEAEGVTYVTAAGNDAGNAYQANWTPISGTYDGKTLTDAESFGGSLVQTITLNTEGYDVPLLLEWNQAYGHATSDLEILVFHNGTLYGTATMQPAGGPNNQPSGEPTNPWLEFDFTASGTYQVAIENLSGPNPGLIKEITEGDGVPVTIGGANVGSVYGHAMTPGAITAGAVSTADTPAFGVNPALSESFSSSGAGTELLFANNGTALSPPDELSPVAVSGVDDINTTVPGGLSDFYGTSAASASLAGVAALILSANPTLTRAQVELIMEETALPMANSAVSGAGLVQVDPAVADATSAPRVMMVDSFKAVESKTGEYYTGYVYDDTDTYQVGTTFTTDPDQDGGSWTYTITNVSVADAAHQNAAYSGKVYDTAFWDPQFGLHTTELGCAGYSAGPPTDLSTYSGSNYLGSDSDMALVDGTYQSFGGAKVVGTMNIDFFKAVNSATGAYFLGYVYDDIGKYHVGSIVQSGTDEDGGTWTYTVTSINQTSAVHQDPSLAGKVYDYFYWDPVYGAHQTDLGYAGYIGGSSTEETSFSGANYLGSDLDQALIDGVWQTFGLGYYVAPLSSGPTMDIDFFKAVNSQTGAYYLGYVYDNTNKYSTGTTFTAPAGVSGAVWTYTITSVGVAGAAHQNQLYAGKVYDYLYWDPIYGIHNTTLGYAGYIGGTATDTTSYSGANYLGSDADQVEILGNAQNIGPAHGPMLVYSFKAVESATGDSYVGVVYDNTGKYAVGDTYTADTDADGGVWTYTITAAANTDSTHQNEFYAGKVYDLSYSDTTYGAHNTVTGYAGYTGAAPDTTSYSGANYLGSDTDQVSILGTDYVFGAGFYVVSPESTGAPIEPPISIGQGLTAEVNAPTGQVTFTGTAGTLQLDNSASFSGTVAGMADQDTLDLRDINPATVQTPTYSGTSSGGTLTVTDGTHNANIALLGNYLASTFVASSDGYGGTIITDSSTPEAASAFSLQYKGFDYVAFFNGAYEDSDSLPSLVQTGANSIEATLDYGIDVATSQVVADPNYTDSLAALGNTIAQAESLGLSVMVRPLIDFLNPAEIAPYSVGEWRQDYQPTNVAAFFASYQQMIVQEAEVAEANGAQMLSIGAELDQLTGPQYLPYWTEIITAVRQVFTGALTYSASWNTASEVSFWSQLNYEGIDCYVPLSNVQNPTLQQLINGWLEPATQATNPSAYAVIGNQSPIQYFENLSAQSGLPLLFTELGYANDSGAAANPSAAGNSPDPTLQAELYQAFFQAWEQSGSSSLIGTYFWEWDPNGSTSNVGPNIDSFSPQNSPAQSVVTAGFDEQIDDSAITNTGDVLVDGAVDISTLTLDSTGMVTLAGGTITGSAGETLDNAGSTIVGTGTIGDGSGDLSVDNASGMIEASGGTLILDTGNAIVNSDTLMAATGATLQIDDNAITNTGNILVDGTLAVDVSTLTLNGTGTVTLAGGTIAGSAGGETLDNAGNTISGTGTIGDGSGHLALDNASGTIEASGGTLILDTGTTITNAGTLEAATGATLQIDDNAITNTGNILVDGTLAVDVSTLTLNGTGTVTLAGGTIAGSAGGETLDNAGNTISGTGTIGDGSGHLALDKASGTIEASGGTLILDTGTTITNAGTLEAATGAYLKIDDPITGTSGSATIGTGATLELSAADSESVTFDGSTGELILDHSSTFSGQIFNFTGSGTLSSSDQIDLTDINYNSIHDSFANGVLTVTDGTDTAKLDFNGSCALANFSFASDGSGGTIVYDPPAPASSVLPPTSSSQNTPASEVQIGGTIGNSTIVASGPNATFIGNGGNDTFMFKPNFGNETINIHAPGTNAIQLDQTTFAHDLAEWATAHDDGHGYAVIADAANDTIALTHVAVAQHHPSDFLI
jgi:hypothetical protein